MFTSKLYKDDCQNDGWVKIAEQKNPWMYICYITAESADNYPDEYIEECINNYFN